VGAQLFSSARAVRRLDAIVAIWIAVWMVLGVLVWHDIDGQAQLAADVIKVGAAVKDTGKALGVVGGLPLVGGQIGDFASRIQSMGAEVQGSGSSSRDAVRRIAIETGIGIGVLPAVLVLALYLPARRRWRGDVGAVAEALAGSSAGPAFEQYLARGAVSVLTWDEVRRVAPDPWGALERGDVRALADAELARLGLTRPAQRISHGQLT
jgi:hypothetical protein